MSVRELKLNYCQEDECSYILADQPITKFIEYIHSLGGSSQAPKLYIVLQDELGELFAPAFEALDEEGVCYKLLRSSELSALSVAELCDVWSHPKKIVPQHALIAAWGDAAFCVYLAALTSLCPPDHSYICMLSSAADALMLHAMMQGASTSQFFLKHELVLQVKPKKLFIPLTDLYDYQLLSSSLVMSEAQRSLLLLTLIGSSIEASQAIWRANYAAIKWLCPASHESYLKSLDSCSSARRLRRKQELQLAYLESLMRLLAHRPKQEGLVCRRRFGGELIAAFKQLELRAEQFALNCTSTYERELKFQASSYADSLRFSARLSCAFGFLERELLRKIEKALQSSGVQEFACDLDPEDLYEAFLPLQHKDDAGQLSFRFVLMRNIAEFELAELDPETLRAHCEAYCASRKQKLPYEYRSSSWKAASDELSEADIQAWEEEFERSRQA